MIKACPTCKQWFQLRTEGLETTYNPDECEYCTDLTDRPNYNPKVQYRYCDPDIIGRKFTDRRINRQYTIIDIQQTRNRAGEIIQEEYITENWCLTQRVTGPMPRSRIQIFVSKYGWDE